MKLSKDGERFVLAVLEDLSSESSTYIRKPKLICPKLFKQVVRFAVAFARLKTGKSNAARMPMIAMTTSISTNVNARRFIIIYDTRGARQYSR